MKKMKLGVISVAATYGSLVGLGVLRMLRGKEAFPGGETPPPELARREAVTEQLALPEPDPEPEQVEAVLQSLSLDSVAHAPLDELARRAAFEERETVVVSPGGGREETDRAYPLGEVVPWTHDSENVKSILREQSLEAAPLDGWASPRPEKLPVPTAAPAVMAFGIVIFAMGLATAFYVCAVGAAIFALAAWRWTGVLQGE